MQKISTMHTSGKNIFQGQPTIGLDLGDRSSAYCVLNEAGEIVLEHKLATTPEAMKEVFGSMPRCRIAMETGTHSPWVSRLLTALGHEVIVAHAQKVRWITKSRRKDEYGGQIIDKADDFYKLRYAHYEGEEVMVTVMRGHEKITKEVTLEALK